MECWRTTLRQRFPWKLEGFCAMTETFGVEKMDAIYHSEMLSYAVVTGDEIICFCFSKEDAQRIMYALNRKNG
jgi:hypothetical protein